MMLKVIVGAIVVLVVSGILLGIIFLIFGETSSSASREVCRDSVLLKARSNIIGKPLVDDINCKTDNVEIESSDTAEIYSEIAGEMYDCWYQFGAHEQDFLDNFDFGLGDNWCFICSRIDFEENVRNDIAEIDVDEFNNYLATETIPLKGDQTFYNYFYDDVDIELQESNSAWLTDEPLYVAFFGDKREEFNTAFWTEAGVGALGLAVCGVSIWATAITAGSATPLTAAFAVKFCSGGIVATGAAITMMTSVKGEYINGLYVGNSGEIIDMCRQ